MRCDRQVHGIEFAVDRHNAILSHASIRAARVERFDRQQVFTGKGGDRGRDPVRALDTLEMLAGVEPGRTHERR